MKDLRVIVIVKEIKFERVWRELEAKKMFLETIICTLCETNSSFPLK